MNKYTWPITIVIAAVILAAGGIGIALALHHNPASAPSASASASGTPTAQTFSASASATGSPSASSSTAASATVTVRPATDFTVCTDPTGASCAGTMRTKPARILTSGDSSTYVDGLTWSGWGGPTAVGSGNMKVNNCQPNCAQGTFTAYPATVTLTGLTPYAGGKQAYADITISAPTAPAPANSYVYSHKVP